ncbi:MAG: 1-deoxy-D-xylulose-5-phosphate reductoisomerase [Acidimicrobiia bacterium]
MKRVALLGCTGSIGTQALEVIAAERDAFQVVSLATGTRLAEMQEQAERFGVSPDRCRVAADGAEAVADLARADDVDVVINAVVGFAGLPVTLAALESGKRLGLANKESLIAGGPVVRSVRDANPGAEIIPIDSEHSAIWQCLRAGRVGEVAEIVLTASGGPFRGKIRSELAQVTRAEALAHPTWSMGPKITVDSSTLMNKGLEVIEAHELFDVGYDQIRVVVHPQSIVHSMVTFTDGATIAQLSQPDMRLPIGLALGAPDRISTPFGSMDWSQPSTLTFESPDFETFPCLEFAYEAGREGGGAPAALSGANEIAVEAFLDGTLRWIEISEVIEAARSVPAPEASTVDDVIAADAFGRERARAEIARRDA